LVKTQTVARCNSFYSLSLVLPIAQTLQLAFCQKPKAKGQEKTISIEK